MERQLGDYSPSSLALTIVNALITPPSEVHTCFHPINFCYVPLRFVCCVTKMWFFYYYNMNDCLMML